VQGYSQTIAGFAFTPFVLLLSTLSRFTGGLADRYGPRMPLIVGPSLAGLGFLLFSFVGVTDGPASYWTTFFPGILVFGLGMAITVAPLTAAVMGALPAHYAGTASGINNAVSRTAGVLTIAIVGAVALFVFAAALESRTAGIGLSSAARAVLQRTSAALGATPVPAEVAPDQVEAVKLAIRLAFVDTSRVVMLICTGLAWISAAMAALLVGGARGAQ
jgi:MFS family permease